MTETIARARTALEALRRYGAAAQVHVAARVAPGGKIDPRRLDADQRAAHGLAWIATTVAALSALADWAEGLTARHRYGDAEALVLALAFGEYAAQMLGGLPISANEYVRPAQLGLAEAARELGTDPAVAAFVAEARLRWSAAAHRSVDSALACWEFH